MCSPAVCNLCTKITWTGCGQHMDQALTSVPPENRQGPGRTGERFRSGQVRPRELDARFDPASGPGCSVVAGGQLVSGAGAPRLAGTRTMGPPGRMRGGR